jgi:Mg2+/citrate symporter
MSDPFIDGSKEDLLKGLPDNSQVGSQRFEQNKMAIFVRCTEDIEKSVITLKDSININAESNDKLSRRIFWLNVILTLATCLGVVVAYLQYLKKG